MRTDAPSRAGQFFLAIALVLATTSAARAQTTQPVTEPDPMKAINQLRTELVDAFNNGDVDRLVSHLDPDAVVTWQNGEVSRGPDGVKQYYNRMMTGPNKIVAKLSASPVVDDRHIYGDWAVSWGNLHDEYELTDGSKFKFDSRFTATIVRRGEEWKITSFHASVNAFNNPILAIAERKAATWSGAIAGVVGLVVGVLVAALLGRRKPRPIAA